MSAERILSLTIFGIWVVAAALAFTGFGLLGAQWGVGETVMVMIPGFVVICPKQFLTIFTLVNLAAFSIEIFPILNANGKFLTSQYSWLSVSHMPYQFHMHISRSPCQVCQTKIFLYRARTVA